MNLKSPQQEAPGNLKSPPERITEDGLTACVKGTADKSTPQKQSTKLSALSPRKRAKQLLLEAARSAARIKSTKGNAKPPSVPPYEQLPNLSFATSIPNIFNDLSEQPLKAALPASVYEKIPRISTRGLVVLVSRVTTCWHRWLMRRVCIQVFVLVS